MSGGYPRTETPSGAATGYWTLCSNQSAEYQRINEFVQTQIIEIVCIQSIKIFWVTMQKVTEVEIRKTFVCRDFLFIQAKLHCKEF